MTLCTSCGSEVADSASFCTSCGKRMPAATQPAAAVTVTRPVCSSCGAQGHPDWVFCTECGKPLNPQPAPVAQAVSVIAAAPSATETAPSSPNAFCTNCGSSLQAGTGFCNNCGQPADSGPVTIISEPTMTNAPTVPPSEARRPSSSELVIASATNAELPQAPVATESAVIASANISAETTRAAAATEPSIDHAPGGPAPQVAAPVYATPSDYPPAQPAGGAFRAVVPVLLLLILVGGFGGWYFMGVVTVIVCSPPDVTVFLDDKELAPASYGRYVIPHLSRQPHLLRVQHPGFADTIERVDFPLTSLHEWVNIKLVPRRPTRSSSPR